MEVIFRVTNMVRFQKCAQQWKHRRNCWGQADLSMSYIICYILYVHHTYSILLHTTCVEELYHHLFYWTALDYIKFSCAATFRSPAIHHWDTSPLQGTITTFPSAILPFVRTIWPDTIAPVTYFGNETWGEHIEIMKSMLYRWVSARLQ